MRFTEILRAHVRNNPDEEHSGSQESSEQSESSPPVEVPVNETTVGRLWLSQLTAETQRSGSERSG